MITLYRIDAARRMSRFYRVYLQADLFGGWCLVREWGRIGREGRVQTKTYPSEQDALADAEKCCTAKRQRGYEAASA